MHISTPQSCQKTYDTKVLYEQFKSFLKAPANKKPKHDVQIKYKKLYSQLKAGNAEKRLILQKRENAQNKIKKNGCKFQKLQNYRSLNAWKQSLILTQSMSNNDGDEILNKILLQQMFKNQLEGQIDNLKSSLSQTRKKLSQIKTNIKILDIKQSKFLQARHLTQAISQHTKQISLINMKNYKNMIQRQDQIIKNFRKIKGNSKKQLQQSQAKYHLQKKQFQIKFKKLRNCYIPLQQQKIQNTKHYKIPKGYKKFLQHLQKLLNILIQKQSYYQNIKSSECTYNLFKKIDLTVLSTQRAQWFKTIQDFQQKFQIKLQTTSILIVKLFKMLKYQNQNYQKKIFQLNHIYDQCQQQQLALIQKQKQFYSPSQYSESIKVQREKEMIKNKKTIQNNSKLFIQFCQLFNSLLTKFRYIFKLFMAMNVDKKIYNEQLYKLDTVLELRDFNYSKYNRGNKLQIIHEDTNPRQIQQILHTQFPNLQFSHMKDIIYLFFNDLRIALFFKRCLLIDKIEQCKDRNNWDSLLEIMMNLKNQSENNYLQRIKQLSNVLKFCFKAIQKGKFQENKNNIEIGIKIFSNTKLLQDYEMQETQGVSCQTSTKLKWTLDFANKENNSQKIQKWGEQSKKNPNHMIRKLHYIKSQNQRKVKLLDLGVSTNTTLFQTYKQNIREDKKEKYRKVIHSIKENNFIQ